MKNRPLMQLSIDKLEALFLGPTEESIKLQTNTRRARVSHHKASKTASEKYFK